MSQRCEVSRDAFVQETLKLVGGKFLTYFLNTTGKRFDEDFVVRGGKIDSFEQLLKMAVNHSTFYNSIGYKMPIKPTKPLGLEDSSYYAPRGLADAQSSWPIRLATHPNVVYSVIADLNGVNIYEAVNDFEEMNSGFANIIQTNESISLRYAAEQQFISLGGNIIHINQTHS